MGPKDEIIERLTEIKEEIAALAAEARELLRGTTEYDAADAYWLTHIEGALDGRGPHITMEATIRALANDQGEEREDILLEA